MSNISFSEKSKKKAVVKTETIETTVSIVEVSDLIKKCEELINFSQDLYKSKLDKNLSDAIVILDLAKASLEQIN